MQFITFSFIDYLFGFSLLWNSVQFFAHFFFLFYYLLAEILWKFWILESCCICWKHFLFSLDGVFCWTEMLNWFFIFHIDNQLPQNDLLWILYFYHWSERLLLSAISFPWMCRSFAGVFCLEYFSVSMAIPKCLNFNNLKIILNL